MKASIVLLPNRIIQGALSLIYPPRCQACGERLELFDRNLLCEICYNNIKLNTPPFCKRCGKSHPFKDDTCESCKFKTYHFDASYSVCIYEGVIRECIHNFKYNGKLALERIFKDLMAEFVEKYVEMKRYNWFVPVPLHRVKHRERTFNQAEVLAAHLSKRFNIPILKRNIVRIRLGTPQVMSPKSKRLEDIKDSFKTKNGHLLKNTSVLLIDDVFTTGATANECSKVLKKAGVNRVDVLTLARSI